MGLFDGGTDPGSAAPVSDIDRYKAAISANESGGNYGLVGPKTRTGDQAYGKYQVMGENVGPWTKEALGKELTPSEFLANPDAQERVFEAKFGQLVTKYGNPQDAASAWFSGRPASQSANLRDVLGTSGASYVNNFNANLAKAGPSAMPIDLNAAPQPLGGNDPSQNQLVLPSERLRQLAESMTQAGQGPVHGYGDALRNFTSLLIGNQSANRYEQQQQAYNKQLGSLLTGAGDDQNKMRAALLQSGNPALMAPAAQSVLQKPQATYQQFGTDIGGEPIILRLHPDGKAERVDINKLPQAVQSQIQSGAAVPGPANFPANAQPAQLPAGAQPQQGAAPQQAQPTQPKMSISDAMRANLTGDNFLDVVKQYNPGVATRITAIANGDEVPQRGDKDALALMKLVYQYDPSFSRTDAEARFNYKKSFTDPNKKTGFQAIALNNFLHHGESLYDRIDLGPNHSYTGFNELANFANPIHYQKNLAQNDKIADFLGPEAVKVASGAEGGEAERIASANSFKSSQGQEAIRGNLRGAATVAEGKLTSLIDNWKAIMGNRPIPPEILNPRAQEILQKLKTPPQENKGAADIPTLTPEQAKDYPAGKQYRTTDGRLMVR